MGARLTIEVETEEVDVYFAELRARMTTRISEVTNYVGRVLVGAIKGNVNREDGGEFGAWAPLAKRTVEERERLGYGGPHPMLKRTEAMLNSITATPGIDYVEAGPESGVPYSIYHDKGEGRIPQRAFVHVNDTVFVELLENMGAYLVDNEPLPEPA